MSAPANGEKCQLSLRARRDLKSLVVVIRSSGKNIRKNDIKLM